MAKYVRPMTRIAVKMMPVAASGQSLIDGLRIYRDIKLMA